MIPKVNINSGEASVASVDGAGGSGGLSKPLCGGFRRSSPLIKLLASKEHLDWLRMDWNADKIITVQD